MLSRTASVHEVAGSIRFWKALASKMALLLAARSARCYSGARWGCCTGVGTWWGWIAGGAKHELSSEFRSDQRVQHPAVDLRLVSAAAPLRQSLQPRVHLQDLHRFQTEPTEGLGVLVHRDRDRLLDRHGVCDPDSLRRAAGSHLSLRRSLGSLALQQRQVAVEHRRL